MNLYFRDGLEYVTSKILELYSKKHETNCVGFHGRYHLIKKYVTIAIVALGKPRRNPHLLNGKKFSTPLFKRARILFIIFLGNLK